MAATRCGDDEGASLKKHDDRIKVLYVNYK